MKDRTRENLVDLLRRFLDEPAAQEAYQDIEAGERWLDTCPAPRPEPRLIATIQAQMTAALRRHRTVRLIRASLAAAAVLVLALVGLLGPRAARQSSMSYAALIPTTIWESHDMAADDLDIVYFTAEIQHLEAQMQALDAGESEIGGAPDEFENELIAIETEFWKGS